MLPPHSIRVAARRVDLADIPLHQRDAASSLILPAPVPEVAAHGEAVVMVNVDSEDALELAPGEDQEPVQALRPHGPDPSLANGVSTRRPNGSANHLQALSRKHLIERTAELLRLRGDHSAKGESDPRTHAYKRGPAAPDKQGCLRLSCSMGGS
jgi:hypothetical protein